MSKKSFTILIVIILVIFGIIGFYIFWSGQNQTVQNNNTNSTTNIFPFGQNGPGTNNQNTSNPLGQATSTVIDISNNTTATLPRLRQISFVPTAGAIAFDVGSSTMIRFMERATGHISETDSNKPEVKEISNVTIPKIHESLWSSDGSQLLAQYLKDDGQTVRTFYAKIATSTTPDNAIQGTFLPDGISEISVYGNKIFYLMGTSYGEQGVTANIDGSNETIVFNSSFGDWAESGLSTSTVSLFSRPSSDIAGSAYILNTLTGKYVKAIGDISGLVALANNNGSLLLWSEPNNGLNTGVTDTKTNISQIIGVKTMPDKCKWSQIQKDIVYCAVPKLIPSGTYPDDWYKGKVSFSDSMWKINTTTGETQNVFDPEFEVGVSMDMIKLGLDQKETTLIFTNKKDMTVWRYNLIP